MRKITLVPYAIHPFEKDTREARELGDVEGKSMLSVITAALTRLAAIQAPTTVSLSGPIKSAYQLSRLECSGQRITGQLEYGIDGIAGRGVNTGSGQNSYRRTVNDAEIIPYFFQFDLPASAKQGLLVVQNMSNRGPVGALRSILQEDFRREFRETTIQYEDLIPDAVLRKFFEEGEAKEIEFYKYSVAPEIATEVGKENEPSKVHAKYTLVAARKNYLGLRPKLNQFLRGEPARTLFSLPADFAEPDKVTVVMQINGSEKRIELTNRHHIRAAIDVSNHVLVDPTTGYPDFESIREVSTGVVDEYRSILDSTA